LLGDLGADVIVVEPPTGHPSRGFGPFVGDVVDPEGSLWWWFYNTNKRSVTLDLATDTHRFVSLVASADILLEGEGAAFFRSLGINDEDIRAQHQGLVWVSVTPYGRNTAESGNFTDLTILAGAGPVWSCGYDDHTLPPVRPVGNQSYHTGAVWAVLGALTAIIHRDRTGSGQLVDVSMHAASNVTTESAVYHWLVAGDTVQRQAMRAATVKPTMPTLAIALDGRDVHTGVPPRTSREFRALLDWLTDLNLRDEFAESFFLEMGAEMDRVDPGLIGVDPEITAIIAAAREALAFIASRLPAYEFFVGGQRRGLACAIVYSPEEVLTDPHFIDRGFAVPLYHEGLDREIVYPGAPFQSERAPWSIRRRAPRIGEHTEEILGAPRQDVRSEAGT
jgi:crotonobetainyl-CoA:carnitine CoA-transferase CaiB-like acyl-CoA transferase